MVKNRKAAVLLFTVVSLLFLMSIGCRKGETEESGKRNGGAAVEKISEETKSVTKKPKETVKMELTEKEDGEEDGTQETPARPLPGKDRLLSNKKDTYFSPEDFIIGDLYNPFEAGPDEKNVFAAVKYFLEQLVQGRVAEEAIHPEWKDILKRSLFYHIERGNLPAAFNIGRVIITENGGQADIRLTNNIGKAAGEIYLDVTGGKWVVTDLQIALEELTIKYEREGVYEPKMYRWIHQY